MLKQSSPLRGCGTAPEPYPPPALVNYETHPAGCLGALGSYSLASTQQARTLWDLLCPQASADIPAHHLRPNAPHTHLPAHPAGCLRALGSYSLASFQQAARVLGACRTRGYLSALAGSPGFSRSPAFTGRCARGRGFVLAQFRSEGLGSKARCMPACISAIGPKPSVRGLFEHRTKTPGPHGSTYR